MQPQSERRQKKEETEAGRPFDAAGTQRKIEGVPSKRNRKYESVSSG